MADHPPPQPQPQALEDIITGNSCKVDLIQTFLDSIATSSTSNAHYTRDQIDISSIAALEEILLLQQQQQQQQQYPRYVNASSTTPTVAVTSFSTDIPRSTGAEHSLPESPPSNHHNHHHHQTMTPNERYLYQQIQHNTQLLNELHQKMDVMMSHLLKIGGGGGEGVSPTTISTNTNTTTTAPSESLSTPTRRSKHDPHPPPQQQQQPPPQQPKTPPRYSFAVVQQQLKTLLWDNQVTILLRKIVHLYILYYTLNQRYCRYHRQQQQIRNNNNNPNQPNNNNNNNFDPFMIFKVLFMMAILWSRVQQSSSTHHTNHHSSNNNNEEDNDTMNVVYTLQLVGAILLVVAFFMYRSGQFIFLYLFYYKYRIPQRVLLQQNNNNSSNQNNQNINTTEDDAAAVNNPPNTNHHMITADEIWTEHLLAVTEQEQQLLRQQQELQNQPLGPDGRRNGAVGGNPNPLEQMIHQIRHRIEWLLVHDWFRGEPIAEAAGARRENDTGEPLEPNAAPHTNNVQPEREQHASPISKFVRMVLITVQDIIIFFVSFVLSILPVWRNIDPDALFRVFQQEQQQRMERQEQGIEDDAVGALQQRQQNDGGIPMVQPPIDPAE